MAAMAKLERCPDCIAAGVPADIARITPIPGRGRGPHGSGRQIQFFCQHCGGLHTSVTTLELHPFPLTGPGSEPAILPGLALSSRGGGA